MKRNKGEVTTKEEALVRLKLACKKIKAEATELSLKVVAQSNLDKKRK